MSVKQGFGFSFGCLLAVVFLGVAGVLVCAGVFSLPQLIEPMREAARERAKDTPTPSTQPVKP